MNRKRPLHVEDADHEQPTIQTRKPRTDAVAEDATRTLNGRHYDDYKVAWICALPTELAAAEAMLDQYHESLPPVDKDNNHYILGSIADHNVVIACLPKGVYGTWSAAHVVSDVRRTFSSLRWGLMVGVGGGIPSDNNDIRLGDIVVGTKVTPYGPGKVTGEGLLRTAESVLPDDALLKVVMRLEAKREQNIEKISERIEAILDDKLKNLPDFKHPQLPDNLFDPKYTHVAGPYQDCRLCCQSQFPTKERPERPSNRPRIHSGVVASGDHLIKESDARDALAKELDAVCFEMEAAGMMRILPCLPIRGICDYADSHKNKSWQRYAAANAAAYARELLETLPAIHDRGLRHSDLRRDDSMCSSQGDDESERRKRMVDSFKFEQMDLRRRTMRATYRRTCQWLLKQPDYQEWLDPGRYERHKGFLWIKGKPGTGKSTLMKFAHGTESKNSKTRQQKSGRPELVVSFFFFAAGGDLEKSVAGMYRSLLVQILKGYPDLQDILDDMIPGNTGHSLSLPELEEIFKEVINRLDHRNLTCFIDALDEGSRLDVVRMVRRFQDIIEDRESGQNEVRICLSSRHYPYIQPRIGIQLVLEDLPGHAQDLEDYVDGNLDIQDPSLREELKAEILAKAQRVFLWVVLVVDEVNLAHLEGLGRDAELQRLGMLPPDLHMLFLYILERHPAEMTTFVHAAVWILFSKRSLSPHEFDHALRASDGTLSSLEGGGLDQDDRLRRRVISSSKGLAEITTVAPPMVQFIHESVRDFLLKDGGLAQLWLGAGTNLIHQGHLLLRDSCYNYIMQHHDQITANFPCPRDFPSFGVIDRLSASWPLAEYAYTNTLHHANEAASTISQAEFLAVFPIATWLSCWNMFEKFTIRHIPSTTALIYLLADQGYGQLIRQLPPDQPLVTSGRFKYPFLAAVAGSHLDAVAALLGRSLEDCRSIDIWNTIKRYATIQFCDGRTPISWAAQAGSLDMLVILRDLGHYVQVEDKSKRSPLSRAMMNRQRDCAEYLLCCGLWGSDWDRWNPIFACLFIRSTKGVQTVLDMDSSKAYGWWEYRGKDDIWGFWMPAKVDPVDCNTPLHVAAVLDMQEAAILLLDNGAHVDPTSEAQRFSALGVAARHGHLGMVKLLVEHGADPGWSDAGRAMPFTLAAESGHEDVAAYLADLHWSTAPTNTGILFAACEAGMIATVESYIGRGGNVNIADHEGMSPLMLAASRNHCDLVRYLIFSGACLDAQDRSNQTACRIAGSNGHIDLALELLERRNTPEDRNYLLSQALKLEYRDRSAPWISRLILANADVTVKGCDSARSPALVAACRAGARGLVRSLVERRARVNTCDRNGTSPLMEASGQLAREIVPFLIEHGANVLAFDDDGNGPVSYALRSPIDDKARKKAFILFLMELGADELACDRDQFRELMDQ